MEENEMNFRRSMLSYFQNKIENAVQTAKKDTYRLWRWCPTCENCY